MINIIATLIYARFAKTKLSGNYISSIVAFYGVFLLFCSSSCLEDFAIEHLLEAIIGVGLMISSCFRFYDNESFKIIFLITYGTMNWIIVKGMSYLNF